MASPMDPPDVSDLEDALDALERERLDACRSILDTVMRTHPTGSVDPQEVNVEEDSLPQKAWACVELSRQRLEDERVTSARVMLHSAIEHAAGRVDPDERSPEPGFQFED